MIKTKKDIEKQVIKNSDIVRVKDCGNIIEIMRSDYFSSGGHIQKINKDEYINLDDGFTYTFEHHEKRIDDIMNVSKSLARGRDIINTNITDVSRVRWLTLTYSENMQDDYKLLNDFHNFNRRCRSIFGHYEYITCAEPQGRGAWHLHVLLIFDKQAPFMANDIVADCWKQGFVKIKKLANVDNVGAYLTAYLGDVPVDDNYKPKASENIKIGEIIDDDGQIKNKKFIKGGRLHFYPSGFHIFRYSKGIKQPIVYHDRYETAKNEKIGTAIPTFSKSMMICNDDFENTITYEYYNLLKR